MEEREVIEILSERRGFIDGVVITGGEPTIQKDLSDFAKRIKELGLLVKIDTNGLLPDVLTELTSAGAVDYIALDIKASLTNYDRACGRKIETKKIKESIDLLLSSDIDYEFRTTCVPSLVNGEEISAICELIRGAKRYSLQQFQNKRTLNPEFGKVEPYSYEEIKRLAEIAEGYVQSVDLRGL
jgi:pyruvate formate lyase activating enzyme